MEIPSPFAAPVHQERYARLQRTLRDSGVECLFCSASTHFRYLTGLPVKPSERLVALLAFQNAPAVLVCPAFERKAFQQNLLAQDLRTWEEDESPYTLVRRILDEREVDLSTLALDPHTEFATYVRLHEEATQEFYLDGAPFLEELRLVKSAEEVESLGAAVRIAADAIEEAAGSLKEGTTELDAARLVRRAMEQRGGAECRVTVQCGRHAALPHGQPGRTRLRKGSVLLIDAGCEVNGYQSDITRTYAFGKPTRHLERIMETVLEAQAHAVRLAREGVRAEEVEAAARETIERAGFGPAFLHRTGHGLGMDVHERPYLVRGNRTPLRPGMTVAVEPAIYLAGRFGVRFEDDVLVGKEAGEPLSPLVSAFRECLLPRT